MKLQSMALMAVVLAGISACNNPPKAGEVTLPTSPVSASAEQGGYAVNHYAVANQVTRVADLSKLPDDSMVRLKGQIVRMIRDDKYEFSDGTGTVVVEINHELWQGRAVYPNQTLTIVGELDKELNPLSRLKVDVDYIEF